MNVHRTTPEIAAQYPRTKLASGDLLLGVRGSYGRVSEIDDDFIGGNVSRDVVRVAVVPQMNRRFVQIQMLSPLYQDFLKRVARGVAVKGVNNADVKASPIAVAPIEEQARIASEVERRLSVLDRMEAEVTANLKRAESLRQSILRRAFSGCLLDGINHGAR